MQGSSDTRAERRMSLQTRYGFVHFDELASDEDRRGAISAPELELHVERLCPGHRAAGPRTDSESEIVTPGANARGRRRRFSKKERLRRRRQSLQAANQAQDEGLEMVHPAREMRRPHFASGSSGGADFQNKPNLTSGEFPSGAYSRDSGTSRSADLQHKPSHSSQEFPSGAYSRKEESSAHTDTEWYNMSTSDTELTLHESRQCEAEPAEALSLESTTASGLLPDDCAQILHEPNQCQDEQADERPPPQHFAPTSSIILATAATGAVAGYYLYRRRRQHSDRQLESPAKKFDMEVKSVIAAEPEMPLDFANICAVGSTGSGKSCLLNFLLDPREAHCFSPEAQTFKTGETTKSCTVECKVVTKRNLKVVDTPGTNESHGADLAHMISVAEALQQVQKLNLVILAMSYQKRLDQQWKDTVLYYRSLIGHKAFCSNVAIVLTGYDLGKPQKRKYMGDQHEAVLTETRNAVKDLLDLESPPLVFAIDCLPEEEETSEAAAGLRKANLSKLFLIGSLFLRNTESFMKRRGLIF
eukprot:TRINITY_DN3264_c0_g4_i1.p1 TRINITY_DN3264_c0_g4~~TRINITY_DN3264_c0_g4_i1.p1  ORF type:complete len:530 (+),score=78.20 TRINITY_DN3264_c0_g4_i1:25-1614(+)